jgi:hypothetical protein
VVAATQRGKIVRWSSDLWGVMNRLQVSILVSMLMALAGAAQSSRHRDLQITVRVLPSSISAKTKVSVAFLNTSDHPLSFPKPVLFCQKLPGGMLVVSKFKPSDPNSGQSKVGMGCSASKGISTSEPNIIEQTKDWLVLGPGEAVDVQDQLSNAMIIGDAGTYQLHVVYSAPSLDAQDRKELRDAGVLLPSPGDYDSDTVTFEIEAPHSDASSTGPPSI